MHASKNIIAGIWLVAVASCMSPAEESAPSKEKRPSGEASVDGIDMLKRFVDELVLINPGQDGFSESLEVGGRVLAPQASYRIAAYETTQELYELVAGGNPSRWRGPRNSVELMTYAEASSFCVRLTSLLKKEKLIRDTQRVRLPTDIEWEYACRAGSVATFCFGPGETAAEFIDQYAWHTGNAAGNDPAVGELKPNQYGLYDVHGYLWEFVDATSASTTDRGGSANSNWAMGGSWKDKASRLACDSRISFSAEAKSDAIGFRCVVSDEQSGPKKTSAQ